MRTTWLWAAGICGVLGAGCSSSGADSVAGGPSATFIGGAPGSGSTTGSGSSNATAGSTDPGEAGVLTAGIWDDNLNYTFFQDFVAVRGGIAGDPGFTFAEYSASHAEFAARTPTTVVDAALVIDTTGSMGDEISYLTSEFANIAGAIGDAFPGADQRWALVVYRDTPATDPGDAYVVRSYDFTGDTQTFAATVGAQSAGGGGDYPESPELGLEQLGQLSWRTDPAAARVAFWVADAPHHTSRAAAMKQAIADAHAAGIHVYPVSASGTDDLLELTMRSAAQITGGRYLFLTDDSGVGDAHKVPEIPCFYVTRLEKALVRVVSMELSGTYIGPAPADVLRTSGDPSASGTCTIGDGGFVQIF
jgi:hypothetical protein